MSDLASVQGNIRISADEMEAYLQVPPPAEDTNYTIKDLQDILDHNNVCYGVISSAPNRPRAREPTSPATCTPWA